METLRDYQIKLKEQFLTLKDLKDQGKQDSNEYRSVYNEMDQTFKIIKEFREISNQDQQFHGQPLQNDLIVERAIFHNQQDTINENNHYIRKQTSIQNEIGLNSNENLYKEAQISEQQIYQLNHQIEIFKKMAKDGFDFQYVPEANEFSNDALNLDRFQQLHPETWKLRRERLMAQTQRMYEDKIMNNQNFQSHDLLGYIDRKLSNPKNPGEIMIDLSMSVENGNQEDVQILGGTLSSHPFELEQIININKIDHAYQLQRKLEQYIEANDFKNDEEKQIAITNLKCLKLYAFQQQLRFQILQNEGNFSKISSKPSDQIIKSQTLGDIMYTRQLVDREFYKRSKVFQQNKKEARTIDKFEQNMRIGQENRKKTRHREFLAEVIQHSKDFHEFHKKKQIQAKRKGIIFKNNLESRKKKDMKEKNIEDQKRRQLLRDNKFDDWLKLINFEKNQRLMEILNQTNNYIEELGEKVSIQKNEVNRIIKGNKGKKSQANQNKQQESDLNSEDEFQKDNLIKESEKDEEEIDFENLDENDKIKYNLKNSSTVYYKISHAINDEVTEQPKMLVGGEMKNYQLYGLNWMVSLYNNNLNGILADEMGLGKTIQTIALFAYLIEVKKNNGPFLVVVPLTTITNWSMEFQKWAPDIKVIVYKGKKKEREEMTKEIIKQEKFNVLITTYEYIMIDKANLKSIIWQYIIVDEGHRMKNQKSKFAMTLGTQYNSAHRILLTGTPLQNNLTELWALLNFLLPKIFSSCEDFQKWFDKALNKTNTSSNKQLTDEEREAMELSEEEQLLIINRLHQILRPFLLRRIKKEVAKDLPQKIEKVIKVELSAQQKVVYKGIQENNQLMIDPSKANQRATSLKNAIMQLRKICNHPYLFDGHEPADGYITDHIFQVSGKFELLDRMIPKLIRTNHKVLIFSQFTQLLDIMQHYFQYRGIPYLILDGRTKPEDRKDRLERFQNPDSPEKVFVLSTKAGGHGLNLQVSDTVIIFDSDWNPQMDEQAKDRAHRIGQMHEVRVFRLITATKVEEGILSKATYKKGLDDKIIQAGMFNDNASDTDRQKKLEELIRKVADDDVDDGEDEESDREIPNDEQINELLARSPEEIELFNQMDQEMYIRENKEEKMKQIMKMKPGLKDYSKFNYRLIQDWEVPNWIKVKPLNKEEEEKKLLDLGKRQRKAFINYDNLSDQQFLRIIEEGKDPNEVLREEANKKERRQRGEDSQDKKDSKKDEDQDLIEDNEYYDSEDDYRGPSSLIKSKRRKKDADENQILPNDQFNVNLDPNGQNKEK